VLIGNPLLTLSTHFAINGNRKTGPCIRINDGRLIGAHVAFFVSITQLVACETAASMAIVKSMESMFLTSKLS